MGARALFIGLFDVVGSPSVCCDSVVHSHGTPDHQVQPGALWLASGAFPEPGSVPEKAQEDNYPLKESD